MNVQGSLSSDDNEDYMNISKFSQNSREPLISIATNKKPKRLLKKPIRKENIKPAKGFKKFLNSSTTTEEDLISTHSDSDIIDVLSDITNFESDTPKSPDFLKDADLKIEDISKNSGHKYAQYGNDPYEVEKELQIERKITLSLIPFLNTWMR